MTFPGDTGLGHDSIAPRAITRLSPDAIKTLAALFVAFERYGEWAEVNDLVLIVLLPENDRGYRPIGLFPTNIRLWFRVQLVTVRIWEKQNEMRLFLAVRALAPRKQPSRFH